MAYKFKKKVGYGVRWRKLTIAGLLLVLFIMVLIKFITIKQYSTDYFVVIYSIVVTSYIFVRFGLSYLYDPEIGQFDSDYLPTVTVAVPAKNEEKAVFETIMKIAAADYPTDKFKILVVNDGSTDNTLGEMNRAKAAAKEIGVEVEVVNWKVNRGKREGMAEAVRRTKSEIILFVDSDSFIEKRAIRELVKYFKTDNSIGGVTAHTIVNNSNDNILTKLQTIHYFISFKVFKSTESLFGTVTCCPGCCTAYRVDYVRKCMSEWYAEDFLGVRCTFGDDRSLTNFLLKRNYKTVFSPTASACTIVPNTYQQFFKQQLRWKKSWARETFLACAFFWKKPAIMVLIFYTGFILTLITPFVVIRALIWYPLTTGTIAVFYFVGLFLTSAFFSLYYRMYTGDKKWYIGLLYSFFYSLILSWQLLYAIPTIRNQKWGTR